MPNPPPRFDARYLIVVSAFVIQAVIIGSMFAYGVFFTALEAELGWSRTLLSASSTLAFFVMGVGGIVAGRLSDRFGPRGVMTVAALIFGLGLSLMSRVTLPWQLFVCFGLMVGVGMAVHDVVTLSTVARWFERRRGAMIGAVKVGTAIGQIALPLLASYLIVHWGWRTACVWLGVGGGLLVLIAAQGLRSQPSNASNTGRTALVSEPALSFRQTVRTRQFWTLCAAQFLFFPTLVTIPVHIVAHGGDLGMSGPAAAGVLALIGAISIGGRLSIGFGVDRIGGRRAMLICFALLLLSLLWLHIADRGWMLIVFAVIYGLAHGGFFTVVSPTIAEYFGMRALGVTFGVIVFFGTLSGALGPLLAGWVFDTQGRYTMAFTTLAVMAALGLVLTWTLGPLDDERVR